MRRARAADPGHAPNPGDREPREGTRCGRPGRAAVVPAARPRMPAGFPRTGIRLGWSGPSPGAAQPVPTNAARRYWLTAASGTRKERPTRIASSSPECTSRYTVIFDTRMIKATSATVRNLTSLRGVSLAIELASSVRSRALDGIRRTSHVRLQGKSRTEKSNPVHSFIVVTVRTQSPGRAPRESHLRRSELQLSRTSFGCYQLTSVAPEQHCGKKTGSRPACTCICTTIRTVQTARARQIRHGMCS